MQREQATTNTPTSSQARLHDERDSPPAARFMSAHEASTLTHFDLCLLCRLAAAATAAADHSPGSAVLLSQPYRTAASFRPERFSLLGRVDCCPMPLPPIAPGTLFVTHPLCHRNTRPWLVEPPCSSYATTLRARRPHRWARLSLLRWALAPPRCRIRSAQVALSSPRQVRTGGCTARAMLRNENPAV